MTVWYVYYFLLQGHIETIFDCQFKPDNPNLIATGSFDGTIKVWDVTTLTLVGSYLGWCNINGVTL